jgi:hypothetical protein
MIVELPEEERQLILLSLAICANLRPGFDDALRRIADRFDGAPMFDNFKRLNADHAG